MNGQYSLRSPAVKRLMKEAEELSESTDQYHAQPLDDNLFEWHFTIRGPADSEFEGGLYHGRIILPTEYPMKPPSIFFVTPNGRFEVHKKICLSISGYHPETWQPSWSIRTALLAIIGFMPTHGRGAIGSLEYPKEQRKKLAKKSKDLKCSECGVVTTILKEETAESKAAGNAEAKKLAAQIDMQGEKTKAISRNNSESTPLSGTSNNASETSTKTDESNSPARNDEAELNRDSNEPRVKLDRETEDDEQTQDDDSVLAPSDHVGVRGPRRSESRMFVTALIILGATIVILMLRRVYLMFNTFPMKDRYEF
ncbi:DgyrCDS8970 [Dimorphilus gyrociliatus]|uniref:DgyrCDS8970 n=1 Tax=Dimorphilus gyrociliatus TaxID=2664684 RepID=A0A7I8VVP8_9ANNE|nr:DgyrCDS8970 [Dimorphilus gyrociliatus]